MKITALHGRLIIAVIPATKTVHCDERNWNSLTITSTSSDLDIPRSTHENLLWCRSFSAKLHCESCRAVVGNCTCGQFDSNPRSHITGGLDSQKIAALSRNLSQVSLPFCPQLAWCYIWVTPPVPRTKYRWAPVNPNMDNTNSWLIRSLVEITLQNVTVSDPPATVPIHLVFVGKASLAFFVVQCCLFYFVVDFFFLLFFCRETLRQNVALPKHIPAKSVCQQTWRMYSREQCRVL